MKGWVADWAPGLAAAAGGQAQAGAGGHGLGSVGCNKRKRIAPAIHPQELAVERCNALRLLHPTVHRHMQPADVVDAGAVARI